MLAVTTEELAVRFRSDVDDRITDGNGSDFGCLWLDYDVYGYMTEACDALAKQTDGLYKTMLLPVVAGNGVVTCPSYILHIREARLVNINRSVEQANTNEPNYSVEKDYGLQHYGTSAIHESSGIPSTFIRDYQRKVLRLVPTPEADDTLELQCTVSITVPLSCGMPLPFMDIEDQRLLLHYMKWRAYEKQDAETEDLVRANHFASLFAEGAAERKSTLRNYRRKPGVIRMAY